MGQTYLKEPEPRFALVLNDPQLDVVEQLLWEEIKICGDCLDGADAEEKRALRQRIKVCKKILQKIADLWGYVG